ncbi:MAG: hypothetical protein IPJ74_25090 [Saprospiraceae bacterium]|nr:hypothetical protein [Saprospiraceae bacterium]
MFSIVAIFIACLGLYGLTAFNISQRVKEIGIRKVLGASVSSIVMLFHKRLIYLTVIAFVLATPIAYYFTAQWLERFAYGKDGLEYLSFCRDCYIDRCKRSGISTVYSRGSGESGGEFEK